LPSLRHVIWDWNGTLFDDSEYCRHVMNAMLTRRNMPPLTPERYQRIFDFPVQRYYERIGFDFTREPFEQLGAEFMRGYEHGRHACRLRDAATQTLDWLRHAAIGMSILSAYRHDALQRILQDHSIAHLFDHILGIDNDYATGKLEQGHQLMARLNLPPSSILLIGDTLHDAEVAHDLGVSCWLLASGSQHPERLAATGLPVFLDHPTLLRHLQQP
ncbi:MAG TPA: HAD family hydrolase, partial [Kiritimatiellia bacterium]|nr:HAD family hydrolase [Kiritimatiellia bacterium]